MSLDEVARQCGGPCNDGLERASSPALSPKRGEAEGDVHQNEEQLDGVTFQERRGLQHDDMGGVEGKAHRSRRRQGAQRPASPLGTGDQQTNAQPRDRYADVVDHPEKVPTGRVFRIGGLVQNGSVERDTGLDVKFVVTDGKNAVPVNYSGVLPDLFREGQGVVALGTRDSAGVFKASEVLAKHDETYMPPEVVDALKRAGKWKEGEGPL